MVLHDEDPLRLAGEMCATLQRPREPMTDLDQIRASAVPRSPEVCEALAPRVAPIQGFIAYGVLWLFIALAFAFGLSAAVLAMLPDHEGPAWVLYVSAIGGLALAYWPFAVWARRKRARARELVRDGVLVDGVVEAISHMRNASSRWIVRVGFQYDSHAHSLPYVFRTRPNVGDVAHVLVHPGMRRALAFEASGQAAVYPVAFDPAPPRR